jgi:ABC-type multidrug transport system ATPase subunit
MTLRIDVRNVSFSAGETKVLDGVSLSIAAGELVALLGPSGSGKSSLIRAITGIQPPDTGKVEIVGGTGARLIGYVPQDDVLHRSIAVEKALGYSARLRLGLDDDAAIDREVDRVLAAVDLSDRRRVKVKRLSGGQRKRVSIAMELLAEPPLMLLDEPTSGLDPALEEQMMALFRRLTGGGRITIVTTHATASLALVDLVVMMARGRVAYVGPPGGLTPFFEAPDLAEVYRIVAKDPARSAERFVRSRLHQTYVVERLSGRPAASA